MLKKGLIFVLFIFCVSMMNAQIISQYVETNSGSTPKGIEIWNNTDSALDFGSNNLVIEKGTNGGTPSTDFTLSSGTLASGAVIVIGTSDMESSASGNGAVFHLKAFSFNGDDALVIKYGGAITDEFGDPGTGDPGSGWNGNGVQTYNQNIQLLDGITTGDTDGWTDPSTRFETVSTNPSGTGGLEGFGVAPSGGGTAASLAISHAGLTEANLSGAVINLTLTDETFSGFDTGDVILNNAPAGTTVSEVTGTDTETTGTVTLAFTGTDFDENITNFSITVTNDGLTGDDPLTSNALTITAVIEPDPEPTNHVTDFVAEAGGSSSILLGWTDATGANLPSGYLIIMNTSDSFADPSDGTEIADDDNNLNIAQGEEIWEWTGLVPATQYYFKIYPYSNSGSNIDYKIDETVPTANATTSSGGTETFANFNEGGSYSDGSFTGQDGSTWTYTQCRGDKHITSETPCLAKSSTANVYSGTISGGIETLSFDYMQAFSTNVNLNVLVNEEIVETVTTSSQQSTVLNSGSITVNEAGNFVIKFEQVNSSSGQVAIDNVSWSGLSGNDPDPEPTNHVTDFEALENGSSSILLGWTDSDGENLPSGYLIMMNTSGSFIDPVDGNAVADDANNLNVAYGEGLAEWPGLNSNTQYFFKIFPYSNSGDDINYKTAATVPTANATTQAAPELPKLIISEVADPNDDTDSKFVELFNPGESSIDLDTGNWFLARQANGGNFADLSLSGVIASHGFFVIANTTTNLSNYDQQSGYISGNGNDGYFLYYNGNHEFGTLVDAYGVIGQDGTDQAWNYENSIAVRNPDIDNPNTVWTSSEWTITSPGNVENTTPGSHNQGNAAHHGHNMGNGQSHTFPSNNPHQQFGLTIASGAGGNVQVNVSSYEEFYPGVSNSYLGWWNININQTGLTTNLEFAYDPEKLNLINPNDLAIYHFDGDTWQNLGGTVDSDNNKISLSGYTGSFSPFTLGDAEDEPLPVTLSSFSASYASPNACLQWTTMSEMNNAGWNVYRGEIEDFAITMAVNPELIAGQGTTSEQTNYNFTDEYTVDEGNMYYYWLESVSYNGDSKLYGPISLYIPTQGENESPDVPASYGLMPNYPNPFNPTTTIQYDLPVDTNIELTIFNLKGAKVKTLYSGFMDAGYHSVNWNGTDSNGKKVGSGIYFYELKTDNYINTRSMLLVK